jgi:hypothetical protein
MLGQRRVGPHFPGMNAGATKRRAAVIELPERIAAPIEARRAYDDPNPRIPSVEAQPELAVLFVSRLLRRGRPR